MKETRNRFMVAVIGLLFCLLLLSACSSNSSLSEEAGMGEQKTPGSEVSTQAPAAEDEAEEPAELFVHSNSGDSVESFDERFGNAIREQFPHYTITYIQTGEGTSKADLIAANQPIDINFDSIGYFMDSMAAHDLQYDMSDLIKKENVDLNQLNPSAVEGMRALSGGEMWGIPVVNVINVLLYNKDLFDRFGVEYPKDGLTWEEAAELSRLMTRVDEGEQYVGLYAEQGHVMRTNQFSLPYIALDAFESNLGKNELWAKVLDAMFVMPGASDGYKEFMRNERQGNTPGKYNLVNDQKLAMYVGLISTIFTSDMDGLNWDLTTMPVFEELPEIGSQPYPIYFSVTKTSEHKEAAIKVIKYLVSEEMQLRNSKRGDVPVLMNESVQQAFAQDSPYKDKNWAAVFAHEPAPMSLKNRYDSIVEQEIRKVLPQIILGEIDMNTAIRTADDAANQRLKAEAVQ